MSWHEFRELAFGLLACESRLWRATHPPEPRAQTGEVPDFTDMTY